MQSHQGEGTDVMRQIFAFEVIADELNSIDTLPPVAKILHFPLKCDSFLPNIYLWFMLHILKT